jgi:hypothetical protein
LLKATRAVLPRAMYLRAFGRVLNFPSRPASRGHVSPFASRRSRLAQYRRIHTANLGQRPNGSLPPRT